MGRRKLVGLTAYGLAALGVLTGCGQRGPLMLPEEPAPSAAPNEDQAQDDEREQDAPG